MGFSVFLLLFAVGASAVVFILARKRVGLGVASGLSALTFVGVSAVSILFIQFALRSMNG